MKFKLIKYLIVIATCQMLLVSSCSSNKVISYFNPKLLKSSHENYFIKTIDKSDKKYFNAINESIKHNMSSHGYDFSSISPDLIITFQLSSNSRSQIINNNNSFLFFNPPTVRDIHELFLLIDMVNSKGKLVWQGSQLLRKPKKKETMDMVLEESVNQIFHTFNKTN